MAIAMVRIAQTLDSRPMLMPDSTVVAGPVRVASAISFTGGRSVEVKYSVIRLDARARPTPTSTAQKTVRSWT